MCSINGFNFKDESLVRRMVNATRHRGPDQEGFYCDENVSLGHARLSIIDLSERGRQPIWNEDKSLCVLCNGEIYNFQELRKKLQERGHKFFSASDTEVILHLYEEKKEKCLENLNGIFGFAIYDKKKGEIFIARDRIGVKPLYYYFDGGKLIFSSEIKGILTHLVPREINDEAFLHYFRLFYIPSPFTLFRGIHKLPPAHYLLYKDRKINIRRYWELQDLPEIKSAEEAQKTIRDLARESVRRQLVSDRPVGIFLSGGIDSTSILGMASEFTSEKIKTYSVGFDIKIESDKFNRDFHLARQTSRYYGTDHHELLVSDIDAKDNIEKAIWHMEEPFPNATIIPIFLLAQLAKKEIAAVLSGDGGDEIFGGYPRYYYNQLIDRYQSIPSSLRKIIPSQFLERLFKKKSLKEKLNTAQGVPRYLLFMGEKTAILSRVLNQEIRENATRDFLRERYPETKFKDPKKYLMYLDFSVYLPDQSLLCYDKMTMAFGLEERVPILDQRLVEFAFKIPTKYKVRGRKNNKWIFRQAMQKYFPSHILNKEKRGFFSPGAKWLRMGLKDLAYEALSPGYCPETQQYFNFQEVRKVLDGHISGKEYNSDMVWSLLTFQIWYKQFIKNG